MKRTIKEWNGLVYSLSYYALGAIMTWFTYKVFGWGYQHAPGLHHFVGFLFWIGGIAWLVRLMVLRLSKSDRPISVSAPVVHFLAVTTCFVMVMEPWHKEPPVTPPDPKTQITITIDSVTHHVNAIDGNGDTLFQDVGDTGRKGH